ncbi:glycosyltransferase [Mycolicibacterium flavescens]|uniref:Glycosyl transferase family 1 n=1 Tax=Mycolicibacterium flavescens TaxID=1776 RepID=A0A1E3RLU3_MYCFV|nr:glycosyltransferase [Mycolicibacterium flavescens]MCV7281756.1 glycosyltransferase [Mycolicibacterium flavescens]ODQ90853.1 hypothetical protein BHQ18_09040 [Mycolicibacterium flavescens]
MPTIQAVKPVARQRVRRLSILDTPTPDACALARFGAGLSRAMERAHVDTRVVDASLLGHADVAIVQHDCDAASGELADHVGRLSVPSIAVLHSVPKSPTAQQRSSVHAIAAAADRLVVMSRAAYACLSREYAVDRGRIAVVPYGATIPGPMRMKRPSRPTILTWGWLAPGDGVERVIDAMASLKDVPGQPRYVVAGPTHPRVLAVDGDSYRDARIEQARRTGVTGSVSLDARHYDGVMLSTLLQQAAVIVLPYDTTEQTASAVLVEAIAHGRPVVATAFPHAVELLSNGAGAVVDHDDADGLAAVLRQVVTQPRLSGAMAAEARRLAPDMAWSAVAAEYLRLANELVAQLAGASAAPD